MIRLGEAFGKNVKQWIEATEPITL